MLSNRVVDGSETIVKQRRQRVLQLKTTSLSVRQDWVLVHLAHKGKGRPAFVDPEYVQT